MASAQNTPFQLWQALVLSHGCRKLGLPLTVAVHTEEAAALLPETELLARTGARVARCPDYAPRGEVYFYGRNHPGTLLETPIEAERLVLVDPDMLPTARLPFERYEIAPGVIVTDTGSYEGYTRADSHEAPRWLPEACSRAGVDYQALVAHGVWGGAPYVIHASDVRRIGQEWLRCLGAMTHIDPAIDGPVPWIAPMWAFPMAAVSLGLEVRHTDTVTQNFGALLLDDQLARGRSMIHWACSEPTLDKRKYLRPEEAWGVWDLRPAGDGTVSDRVLAEIAEVAGDFGLDDHGRRAGLLGREGPAPFRQAAVEVEVEPLSEAPDPVRYGADPGVDEHAAVAAAEVARWFTQDGAGKGGGREAHVSRLGRPEPRLPRALRARGRRRAG